MMMTMKWKLRWTLYANGEAVQRNERGLHGLQSCKTRLLDIRREAEEAGFVLLDAHAMPEMACGTVRLLGAASTGVARCGAL